MCRQSQVAMANDVGERLDSRLWDACGRIWPLFAQSALTVSMRTGGWLVWVVDG